MGFRFGQSFVRALSLSMAATINIIPNNQKFHHLILLGFCSVCGIRLRLKLVAMPAETINAGITQGWPNKKYVATAPNTIMIQVIVFLIASGKAAKAA